MKSQKSGRSDKSSDLRGSQGEVAGQFVLGCVLESWKSPVLLGNIQKQRDLFLIAFVDIEKVPWFQIMKCMQSRSRQLP